MPNAGEDHRHVAVVSSFDDFGVADAAAGLDDGGGAGFGGGDESVGGREERVARARAAFYVESRFFRFPHGNLYGVHAAHLSSADAQRAVGGGKHDGVGF